MGGDGAYWVLGWGWIQRFLLDPFLSFFLCTIMDVLNKLLALLGCYLLMNEGQRRIVKWEKMMIYFKIWGGKGQWMGLKRGFCYYCWATEIAGNNYNTHIHKRKEKKTKNQKPHFEWTYKQSSVCVNNLRTLTDRDLSCEYCRFYIPTKSFTNLNRQN